MPHQPDPTVRHFSAEEFLARGRRPPQPTDEERQLIQHELRRAPLRPETVYIVADWLRVDVKAVEEEARRLGLDPSGADAT